MKCHMTLLIFHSPNCEITLNHISYWDTLLWATAHVLQCYAMVCQAWQRSDICFHSGKQNLSQTDIEDLITVTTSKGGIMAMAL